MFYTGSNLNKQECENFLTDMCEIDKNITDTGIEIIILIKDRKNLVAIIQCFYYNFKRPYSYRRTNSLHIKNLDVNDEFTKKGIATYLMQEVIKIAEEKKIKHITLNPVASTSIISQKRLEQFYKSFKFKTLFNKVKEIEFRIVID